MKINARCYYNKQTLEIVCFTNEYEGAYMTAPTKEDDFKKYPILKGRDINLYDYIEIEYGALSRILMYSKSYYIDSETKELVVEYLEHGEIEAPIENHEGDLIERISILEDDNAMLLLDLAEKEMRIEQLENDIADLLLSVGGMI